MRNIAVFGLLCAALGLAQSAHAADLDPSFAPPPAYGEPDAASELGTGWYLRGDAGYSDTSRQQVFGDVPALRSSMDWTGDVGAGYRWNNWLRTDLTLNFDGYQDHSAKGAVSDQICPYQLYSQTEQVTNLEDGYLWSAQTGTCSNVERSSMLKTDVMVGGYIDIGTWSGITPYVGAGVGFARIDTWNSLSYVKNSDGTVYQTDLSPVGTYPLIWGAPDANGNGFVALKPQPINPTTGLPVAFAKQDWSTNTHRTRYNFAWSLMGGFAYAIDDHLSVDLGYRYVNLGGYTDASGKSKTIDAQQVRLGLRYAID